MNEWDIGNEHQSNWNIHKVFISPIVISFKDCSARAIFLHFPFLIVVDFVVVVVFTGDGGGFFADFYVFFSHFYSVIMFVTSIQNDTIRYDVQWHGILYTCSIRSKAIPTRRGKSRVMFYDLLLLSLQWQEMGNMLSLSPSSFSLSVFFSHSHSSSTHLSFRCKCIV